MKFEDDTDPNSILSDALENLENAEEINEAADNLQQVLGTEPGSTGGSVTFNDLLAANELADETVQHAIADELAPPCGCVLSIYLAAPVVSNNDFVGLGTSSGGAMGFVRNNVVIPQTATITGLVFSIRDNSLSATDSVTAEIFVSTDCGVTPLATGIIATVNGPNPPNCCAFSPGTFAVHQCDLLSVQIKNDMTEDPALPDGVAATILYTIP
ncbi:hypothetical protein [Neobacillus sp. NPDC093127]|uniref:hypothetical protein n=1 Tax=Neobacillus sp. NPDC093127 TaxID=3364296 RepID=UPI00380983CA